MKLVKKINTAFTTILLAIFYIIVVGIARCITLLQHTRELTHDSYWQTKKHKLPKQYFSSPY